jgi:2-dehydro-3-deoxyphosphogluconate aldolase/(4S)-4-hydroxy-2-oxoglutarate aldolase
MPETISQTIERVGLIPVLRAKNAAQAHAIVKAMIAGGVNVVEVTMTVPGAVGILKELKREYGNELLLGSGTVTTAEEAEATIEAGAEFVVSPSFHPEVIAKTRALGKVSIPGALTPSEVITAWNAGADYVKVFPCSAVGGASYLKALLAPFPHLKLIPTGGVTLQTAEGFLRAGAHALGVGSDLVNLAAVDAGTPETITETARAYLKVLAQVRQG